MKSNKIPTWRVVLFYAGSVMGVIGLLMFLTPFLSVGLVAFSSDAFAFEDTIFGSFGVAVIGFIFILLGSSLRSLGKYGAAGSGVILNPKQAREDIKPHAKAVGGILNDAFEEVDVFSKNSNEVIKIRCKACNALNDEDATYCKSCGAKI